MNLKLGDCSQPKLKIFGKINGQKKINRKTEDEQYAFLTKMAKN